jgi:hypothetical protein
MLNMCVCVIFLYYFPILFLPTVFFTGQIKAGKDADIQHVWTNITRIQARRQSYHNKVPITISREFSTKASDILRFF